jgi:hypothetical protein
LNHKTFHMAVLGRTLEHLGVQMYKQRPTAIAELVANCWDANASHVWVTAPVENYNKAASSFTIEDDGDGMTSDEIEHHYLVVGRNRRRAAQDAVKSAGGDNGRRVMGRKGIGKLAGFGIASKVEVTTWRDGVATKLTLDMDRLKLDDAKMDTVGIPGEETEVPADVRCSDHGTRLVLRDLKHATPIEPSRLEESLARRFSRTVRGLMTIEVNGQMISEPEMDWEFVVPPEGEVAEDNLGDDRVVRYSYGFVKTPIQSRELRGFTILTNGKTAQAPPFYFDVEATASGQHGTKYLIGTIEADFLDGGTDDESDLVSTDRQEIDWESSASSDLLAWGAKLTRKALTDFRDFRKEAVKRRVLEDPQLRSRMDHLDKASRDRAERLLGSIGLLDAESGTELELASNLISAFEFRQFHDVVDQIEAAEDNPEQLQLLLSSIGDWKALESRAVLEVIKGRISIIDKFHEMIVNDAPETAPKVGAENMHDLLADFPWLLHPEWQVLSEETSISKQLRNWSEADLADSLSPEEQRERYDFLALGDQVRLVLIEIKRPGYAPNLEDLQRLIRYRSNLGKGTVSTIDSVLISSKQFAEDKGLIDSLPVISLSWAEVHDRTKAYYEHYRALLEGDAEHPDFHAKETEVVRTREVLDTGAYRGKALRAAGLGPQERIRHEPEQDGGEK